MKVRKPSFEASNHNVYLLVGVWQTADGGPTVYSGTYLGFQARYASSRAYEKQSELIIGLLGASDEIIKMAYAKKRHSGYKIATAKSNERPLREVYNTTFENPPRRK